MANLDEVLGTDIIHRSDLQRAATGDLATVSGMDNLRIALFHRLVTVPGTIVHRPSYGVGIKRYQNAVASLANQRKIALDIQANFLAEDRLTGVKSVSFEVNEKNPAMTKLIVKADVAGLGAQEFVFTPFGEGV